MHPSFHNKEEFKRREREVCWGEGRKHENEGNEREEENKEGKENFY
jgi:hypothetical protein